MILSYDKVLYSEGNPPSISSRFPRFIGKIGNELRSEGNLVTYITGFPTENGIKAEILSDKTGKMVYSEKVFK